VHAACATFASGNACAPDKKAYDRLQISAKRLAGELVGGLPDFCARNQSTSQDSRQFQLGFKFIF